MMMFKKHDFGLLFKTAALKSVLVVFCFTVTQTKAQHYNFSRLNDKDIVPSSFVYKTFEDSKGYLWFLTEKSISRFDGKKAKIFGPADGYRDGGAYQILEDKEGVIWIVTTNFRLYYFKNETFDALDDITISWLHIDASDNKWITTRHYSSIYKLNKDYTYSSPLLSQYGKMHIHTFFVINDSSYLYSANTGIYHLLNGKITKLLSNNTYRGLGAGRFFAVKNKIYITLDDGIYEFSNNRVQKKYAFVKNEVFDLCADGNYIWTGTERGLIRLKLEKDSLLAAGNYVLDKPTLSITKTTENNLWITTVQNGVFILNPQSNHYLSTNSIIKNTINYLRQDLTGLYLFTYTPAYYFLSGKKISKHTIPQSPDKSDKRIVKGARNISDSQIAVYTSRSLLLSKNKFTFWDRDSPQIVSGLSNPIFMTMEGSLNLNYKGKILVRGSDIIRLDTTLRMYTNGGGPLLYHGDTLYYGSEKGLVKLYYANKILQYRIIDIKGHISKVIAYRNKIYIITQTNGLYVLDHGNITNITTANGLPANYCSAIVPYKNHIWIGTNKGVSRIRVSDLSIRNFTEKDYLVNDQVNDLQIYNDSVYVGTNSGLTSFSVQTGPERTIPHIYLEKLLLNNSIDMVRNDFIETDYLNNNFNLEFVSPGYRSGKANRFRLIINSGSVTDTLHYDNSSIQLLALMPGRYNITADVMNIDGVWSTKPVILDLLIHPPFWKTIWFISLVILIICSVVGYVIWVSVRRQQEKQDYRRKITESELKSLRLYMNPHFLFNSLTSLQSFILTVKTGEANHFITKFSKLIRAVMSYSVRGELLLKEEIQLLKDYLELESVRFGTGFTYHIGYEEGINIENISIPSLIIQPFVENAIKHGVTGVSEQCYIKVWFEMREKELYCIVADNGKGRSKEPKKDTDHISSGIKFTEERIKLLISHKGEPVIRIRDTDPGNNLMPGTTVEIHVPVLNDQNDD